VGLHFLLLYLLRGVYVMGSWREIRRCFVAQMFPIFTENWQHMQAVLVDALELGPTIIAFSGDEKLDGTDVWQH